MEKPKVNRYEIMCLFREDGKTQKEELTKKIRQVSDELEIKDLKTERLAWSVKVENYLLLQVKTSPEKILQIEKILQQSPIQYLLINLDKEKQIKVKKRILDDQNISQQVITEEKESVPSSEKIDKSRFVE